jgi:hypothetical protein
MESINLNIPTFYKFVSAVRLLDTYANITFDKDGYSSSVTSQFQMGVFSVKESNDLTEPLSLNLDVKKLLSALPSKGVGELKLTHDNGQLTVTIGKSKYKMTTIVKQQIRECKPIQQKFLEGNLFSVNSVELYKAFKAVKDFAENQSTFFKVSSNLLELYDPDEQSVQGITIEHEPTDTFASKLNNDLIADIIEYFSKSDETVTLNLLNEYPLAMLNSVSTIIVAPMVEDD